MANMRGYTGGEPSLDEPELVMDEWVAAEMVEAFLRDEVLIVRTIARNLDRGAEAQANEQAAQLVREMQDLGVAEGWYRDAELRELVWDAVLDEEVE